MAGTNERLVLVTGSTKGIGRAIAAAYVSNGDQVVVHGRDPAQADAVRAELGAHASVHGDLGTAEGCTAVREELEAHGPLGVLVNNAGIFEVKDFFAVGDEDWLHYFQVNVLSAVRMSRAFLPGMLERDSGCIVNVASEAGFKPLPQMIHYSVTKTALISLARGLAELTKGTRVTVNSLLPGPTWTEGVAEYCEGLAEKEGKSTEEVVKDYFREHEPTSLVQRFLDVEEIAGATVFLTSNAAVNGSALRAEGGILRSI